MKKKTKKKDKKSLYEEDDYLYEEYLKAKAAFEMHIKEHQEALYKEQVAIMLKEMVQEQFNKDLKGILDE